MLRIETDFSENLCQEFAPVKEEMSEAKPQKLARMVDELRTIRMTKEDGNGLMAHIPPQKCSFTCNSKGHWLYLVKTKAPNKTNR